MFFRHSVLVLTTLIGLGGPMMSAGAQDLGFTYLEGGFMAGFVNGVEESVAFTDNGRLELESDSGGGAFIGGAWQFQERLHLFGEYSLINQELEIDDGIEPSESDYNLVRWRIGAGYAHVLSPSVSLYGRLSFDNAEFKDVPVVGFDLDAADGIGGEAGIIWTATTALELQGHVRYTSVGEVVIEGSDAFDSDTLIGLNGRWYFRPNVALVTGYEFGKITTLNVSARFTF